MPIRVRLTLWYLLMRVDADERANVYDRMTALVAPRLVARLVIWLVAWFVAWK